MEYQTPGLAQSPAVDSATRGTGAEATSPEGAWADPAALRAIMQLLGSDEPDRNAVLELWGRVGPQAQQMIMAERDTAQPMMRILTSVAPEGAGLEEPEAAEEQPPGEFDPQIALTLARRTQAIAFTMATRAGAQATGQVAGDEAGGEAAPVYLDQLENQGDGGDVTGSNMCNVTTLAMQIATLGGGVDSARRAVIEVLEDRGGKVTAEQRTSATLPDLIHQRFRLWKADDWRTAAANREPPFDLKRYKGFESWGIKESMKFHQNSACLAFVFTEVEKRLDGLGDIVVDESTYDKAGAATGTSALHAGLDLVSQDYFERVLAPELESGAMVMVSTKLTGGHIAMLVDVLSDGVVINDPYGAKPAGKGPYLRNDHDAEAAREAVATLASPGRWRENPEPEQWLEKAGDADKYGKWGERNFFTWKELVEWKIGVWNSVARSDVGAKA